MAVVTERRTAQESPIRTRVGELCVLVALVAIAAGFIVQAPQGRSFHPVDLGSAFFPRVISAILVVLILAHVVTTLGGRGRRETTTGVPWRLVVPMGVAIVAYPLLWELGYLPVTAAFVIVTMLAAGVRSWVSLAGAAVIYTAASYWVFERVLYIPLP